MTSELASREELPGVLGLAFLGFPLHAPKKPDVKRSTHLYQVTLPMLFLQGTRDDLAEMGRMRSVCADLRRAGRGNRAEGGRRCTRWRGRITPSTCSSARAGPTRRSWMSCAIQCANGCRRWALTFPRDLHPEPKPARRHRSTCRASPRAGRPGRGQDLLPHRADPAFRGCAGHSAGADLRGDLHQPRRGRDRGPAAGGGGRSCRRHDRRDDPLALRLPAARARGADRRAARVRHRRRDLPGAGAAAAGGVPSVGHVAPERLHAGIAWRARSCIPTACSCWPTTRRGSRGESCSTTTTSSSARRSCSSCPTCVREVAGRWDAVLVDECQDLNPVQYAVISASPRDTGTSSRWATTSSRSSRGRAPSRRCCAT